MEQMNFNPEQPIVNFLQNYGITSSMYLDYITFEESWLNNYELNMEECPFDAFPFSKIEMSLLNANGEVKIGSNILKLTQNGFVYIANTDVMTLIRIDNGDMTALLEPTVTTNLLEEGGSRGSCTSWKQSTKTYYYSNKKIASLVYFHAYPWKASAGAEMTAYKKNNKGKYVKYTLNLKVSIYAVFRDNNCNGAYYPGYQSKGFKHTKSLSVSTTLWGAFPGYRAENDNSVTGKFEVEGNVWFLDLKW
jgi:hypothetical protein